MDGERRLQCMEKGAENMCRGVEGMSGDEMIKQGVLRA